MVIILISFLLVILLVGITIWKKKELPVSISSLVYLFKWKWTWTIWIWLVAGTLVYPLFTALPVAYKFLGFLSIFGLMFAGATPIFNKDNYKFHGIFGAIAEIASQFCVIVIQPWAMLLWSSLVVLLLKFRDQIYDKETFIIELIGIFTLYLSLFLSYIF